MSSNHIALFTFTLGKEESISPVALRAMWARATGSPDISVGRRQPESARGDRPVYTLYAPQGLADLREVELRLRGLLESAHLHASLTPLHP